MRGHYRTGEVERLLGVGEHVLRYWEKELPILAPTRSAFGRREWSEPDLALLLRVRHLVRDRGLTLAAAMDVLIGERSKDGGSRSALLSEIRAILVRIFFDAGSLTRRAASITAAFGTRMDIRSDVPGGTPPCVQDSTKET
ncbi:MAG: MerR family transcriptional regulator [Spirochaetales bacterium]|nr:MAG: MerR family transcriptional regulator [Spirochaetales bacterium]